MLIATLIHPVKNFYGRGLTFVFDRHTLRPQSFVLLQDLPLYLGGLLGWTISLGRGLSGQDVV